MSDDLLGIAKQEAERLRDELARNVTFQKLQQVQKLIDLYERIDPQPVIETVLAAKASQPPRSRSNGKAAPKRTKTAMILEAATEYLRRKGGRAMSSEILVALLEQGFDISGKRPSTAVASYLTNSGLFDNVPGEGYGIKGQKDKAPPEDSESASNTGESGSSTAIVSEGVAPQ